MNITYNDNEKMHHARQSYTSTSSTEPQTPNTLDLKSYKDHMYSFVKTLNLPLLDGGDASILQKLRKLCPPPAVLDQRKRLAQSTCGPATNFHAGLDC